MSERRIVDKPVSEDVLAQMASAIPTQLRQTPEDRGAGIIRWQLPDGSIVPWPENRGIPGMRERRR